MLRNVIGVLNRSPPDLLGEIVLVDDHSTLEELELLPEHLARLAKDLPPNKVRSVRRDVHDGIVGARVRGAEESAFPVVLFLDSHAEVCDGWLEPLVARIHEDRTRVVVPNIRGINIDTMTLIPGDSWPPARGFFNWRLSFTIETADTVLDLAEPGVDLKTAAMKSPVMPGGLFAMDRKLFFEVTCAPIFQRLLSIHTIPLKLSHVCFDCVQTRRMCSGKERCLCPQLSEKLAHLL